MKNKKGFILTETLVVTVFLVTISTFIYVSVIPLMGRYEDLAFREADIDIVYKLYNLRKLLYNDENREYIITPTTDVKDITCGDFYRNNYCTELLRQMKLTNYKFIYIKNIFDNMDKIKAIEATMNTVELRTYLERYIDEPDEYLLLLDRDNNTIAHLLYASFVQEDW